MKDPMKGVIAAALAAQGLRDVPEEVVAYIVGPLSDLVDPDVETAAALLSESCEVEVGVAREAALRAAEAVARCGLAEASAPMVESAEALEAPRSLASSGGQQAAAAGPPPPPTGGGGSGGDEESALKPKPEKKEKKKKSNKKAFVSTKKKALVAAEDEDQAALDELDDFSSAWRECREAGRAWGGRGFGGRGVARRYQSVSSSSRDVIVDGVTMAFAGRELLQRAELRLAAGRRYALLGRNGVGKSSLLRRIATGSLPGLPQHLRVAYVAQEAAHCSTVSSSSCSSAAADGETTAVEALVDGACRRRRRRLEAEAEALEAALAASPACSSSSSSCGDSGEDQGDAEEVASRLCEVQGELEELTEGAAAAGARAALSRLGFDEARAATPVSRLSGGWRMRLELAGAFVEKSDLVCLDEPTNHLDLSGVLWLERHLAAGGTEEGDDVDAARRSSGRPTVLFVSHDRAFVEAVATDIITFEDKKLEYFRGGLAAFDKSRDERASAHQHRLDARSRQEVAARESAEKMRARATGGGHTNDNALRQAKQRLAKIERIGLFRDDGRRFKTHSLAKLDEAALRLPDRVEASRAAREDRFEFPQPDLVVVNKRDLVALDDVDVGHVLDDSSVAVLVERAAAALAPGSRVAVVGDNGAGKTTLLKTMAGLVEPLAGEVRSHPKLRLAYVRQDHADALPADATTPTDLLTQSFGVSELEARAKLGKFGIAATAKLPLRKLSGGQKARLSLAAATWHAPHLILMDEPTNHLDMHALDALAAALDDFRGAVVVVSHNRAFLGACCTELWELTPHRRLVVHRDADFHDLFAAYADRALSSATGGVGATSRPDSATRADRRVHALDASQRRSSSRTARRAPAAGGAAQRTAFI